MQPLLRYLPHFHIDGTLRPAGGEGQGRSPPVNGGHAAMDAVHAEPPAPKYSQEEVSLAVAQATREAKAKAKAELAASEAARREDAERFEATMAERLAIARAEWSETEAERLATAVGESFNLLEKRIGDALGRILAPFVSQAVRGRVIEDVGHAIAGLLTQPAPPGAPDAVITVRGPSDLLAALRERLGEPEGIVFSPAAGADIEVTRSDTLIETRLGAWADLLAAAGTEDTDKGGVGGG
ncbi:hypothetical protein V5F53_17400 [Xanthobacter sp. V4C-4]|uniref:hypothetical protein n=1 Tax=Xanthobacter cornucopiae TaxID=3119924 RepID=UPI00372BBFD9